MLQILPVLHMFYLNVFFVNRFLQDLRKSGNILPLPIPHHNIHGSGTKDVFYRPTVVLIQQHHKGQLWEILDGVKRLIARILDMQQHNCRARRLAEFLQIFPGVGHFQVHGIPTNGVEFIQHRIFPTAGFPID